MVTVRKRVVKGRTYYYLQHSVRENGEVKKKERYLGAKIPKDIEGIKRQFLYEINKEKWFDPFERIRENYWKEMKLMPKSAKDKELRAFSIRFTYDTQRIEGSTLTLRETAELLERGIAPRGRPMEDVKESEAHEKIFYEMLQYEKHLSLQILLYWHKRMFESTKPDIAGQIRRHQVAISGSRFVPPFPVEIHPMLREFFSWYNRSKNEVNPVELTALVHLKFVSIHPFSDGNGRVARLMMNFALNKYGFPMLNIPYGKRSSYYNALERSQLTKDESIFLRWFFRRYLEEHKTLDKD